MPLSEKQRRHLEQRLQEERGRVRRDLDRVLGEQSAEDEQDRAGDLSLVPMHMADRGTDTSAEELDTANAERMSRELEEIDAALERLYRDPEHFGIAEDTGKPIPFERLDIIPWARTGAQAEA